MKKACLYCSKIFESEDRLSQHLTEKHMELLTTPSVEELESKRRKAIWEFLCSDGQDKNLLMKAKIAITSKAAEAADEAARNQAQTNNIVMARGLSETKSEFKEYLRLVMPANAMLADSSSPGRKVN